MTKKEFKKTKAALQHELDDIRSLEQEYRQKLTELRSRESEVKKQLSAMDEEPVTDQKNTPWIHLVHQFYYDDFNEMISKWQEESAGKIEIRQPTYITFKPGSKSFIIRTLVKHVIKHQEPEFFKISDRMLFSYLATHSNLGSFESIKRAFYRYKKEVVT